MTDEDKRIKAKTIRRSFATLTILFCLSLALFAWVLSDVQDLSQKTARLSARTALLVTENRHRVNDIQNSRVSSCKQTYGGVREVLYPFFPKKHNRTKTEQANINKLNRNITRLQNQCSIQTRPIKKINNKS